MKEKILKLTEILHKKPQDFGKKKLLTLLKYRCLRRPKKRILGLHLKEVMINILIAHFVQMVFPAGTV